MTSEISTAELARQVRDVLLRFQTLADRLDNSYVTKETLDLYQRLVEQTLSNIDKTVSAAADKTKVADLERDKAEKSVTDDLSRRVGLLEDNQKWITRLIIMLVVVAVVGLVIATGGAK